MKTSIFYLSLTSSAKSIGAGLATIGVVGAGAGIGIVFSWYGTSFENGLKFYFSKFFYI